MPFRTAAEYFHDAEVCRQNALSGHRHTEGWLKLAEGWEFLARSLSRAHPRAGVSKYETVSQMADVHTELGA
jgi:hypothetical protein